MREVAAIDKEFKGCHIVSSQNAWMSTELTHVWINKVLGTFFFSLNAILFGTFTSVTSRTALNLLYTLKILMYLSFPGDVLNIFRLLM